jgi:hypothetical protein
MAFSPLTRIWSISLGMAHSETKVHAKIGPVSAMVFFLKVLTNSSNQTIYLMRFSAISYFKHKRSRLSDQDVFLSIN